MNIPERIPQCMEALERVVWGPGVQSDDRLEILWGLTLAWPPALASEAYQRFYSGCDDTWYMRATLLERLREIGFGQPHKEPDDIAFFESLPDRVKVWRGCSASRVRGLSWTTARDTALRFARGHRMIQVPNPTLASAVIPKTAIFFVVTNRKESEIILDPRRLSRLTTEPFSPE